MAKNASWPPAMRKHTPSGRARVRWHGKDTYLGAWGSPEADAAYLAFLRDNNPGGPSAPVLSGGHGPAPSSASVAVAVAGWITGDGKRYEGSPELWHYKKALKYLIADHADRRAADFGVLDLERVRDAMVRDGLLDRYVAALVRRLRTVWKRLELEGFVPRGSHAHLKTLGPIPPNDRRVKRAPRRKACTEADALAVAAHARPAVRDAILVGLRTGMRPSEICRMRPCDIDRSDAGLWVYRPPEHKCSWRGQTREVPLGPACVAVIRARVEAAADTEYLFRPGRPRGRAGKGVRQGLRFDAASLGQRVRAAAKRAGVTGFTMYTLRHLVKDKATREMGLDSARALLGQKSLDTTNGYGSAIDLKTAGEAARRLG